MDLFSTHARSDRTPKRANESQHGFLDRTGSSFFVPVREVLQGWLDALPPQHQSGVAGNLTSGDDDAFESAFWELYLHRVLTGSGFTVELHPEVPGTRKHPDFLVHARQPFYLEAVSVGTHPKKKTEQRRLREVEAILDDARVDGWTLSFSWHKIGGRPLKATKLKRHLLHWVGQLAVGDAHEYALPLLAFEEDGWELEFTALPVGTKSAPLVAIRGAGRAVGVNNRQGLARVLTTKSKRYGSGLPFPLVTAVLSNTEFPTRLYEVQPTLYGLHALGPASVLDFSELATDGHWRTAQGWRRAHNPYVVVGAGINLYNMHKRAPWVWRTLDPRVSADLDLTWASPIDVTVAEPEEPKASPNLAALGLTELWCSGDPDFDES